MSARPEDPCASPWFGRKFTQGRMPAAAVEWRLARIDEVIAAGGNLTDAARAWGHSQAGQVIAFLELRDLDRLDALRAGYRRSALSRESYLARCLAVAMAAKLGLTQPEISRLLEISPVALMRWAETNGAQEDIIGMFQAVGRIQSGRIRR